jgi:hypothetical protein
MLLCRQVPVMVLLLIAVESIEAAAENSEVKK